VARKRRKRGTGSLVQRGTLWQGQISIGAGPSRERRTYTSHNEADVRFWLAEASRAKRRGEDPASVRSTVADYLEDWLTEIGHSVRPTTLRGYTIHVERWIVPVIGDIPLLDLQPAGVRRVRDNVIRSGRSSRTAQSVLLTLRMALGQAVSDEIVRRNVAVGIRPPRQAPRQFAATSVADARAIMAAFDGHPLGPLVTVAIGTGLRLGELLGLRWADVSGGLIRVTGSVRPVPRENGRGYVVQRSSETKTRRSARTLEVAPFVAVAIESERRRQAETGAISPYVFVTIGRRDRAGELVLYDPRAVTRAFQDQLARSGLPRMRFHDLRHAYATIMLAAGVPLQVISASLGHTSVATTAAVYAHVLPELQRDAAAKLDEILSRR
jgi:integrase